MEACVGAHHLSRQLLALGHDVKLVPEQFVKPFLKGQENDFRDAEAVAEAVQRPTMRFVPTKSVDQLDLQTLHRVRSRLVSQRTAIVNQSRAFLLERGIAVRQGLRFLRQALPDILANRTDVLTLRMVSMIEDLAGDLHHLDERIDQVTGEIETLAVEGPFYDTGNSVLAITGGTGEYAGARAEMALSDVSGGKGEKYSFTYRIQ